MMMADLGAAHPAEEIVPIVCAFIFAISYPPLPGFGIDGKQYDCHPDEERQKSRSKTGNTETVAPLIKPDGPEEDESKACRDERERLQKASNERGLTVATWVLCFSTVWLAVATTGLWVVTGFMWNITRQAVQDGQRSLRAAVRMANAAERHAIVAERTLSEHQRPWIMRDVVNVQWRREPGGPGNVNNFWVSLKWKNVGRSPAIIRQFQFALTDRNLLPLVPDYSVCQPLGVVPSLAEGGEFDTQQVGPGGPVRSDEPVIEYVFWGRLIYAEMNGTDHFSGFALDISPHFPAVVEHNNDAYNYYT